MTDWDYKDRREVEQVCGACLFVRREAYEQTQGLRPGLETSCTSRTRTFASAYAGPVGKIYFVPEARIKLPAQRQQQRLAKPRSHDLGLQQEPATITSPAITVVSPACDFEGDSPARHGASPLSPGPAIAAIRPSSRDQVRLFREVWRQSMAYDAGGWKGRRRSPI